MDRPRFTKKVEVKKKKRTDSFQRESLRTRKIEPGSKVYDTARRLPSLAPPAPPTPPAPETNTRFFSERQLYNAEKQTYEVPPPPSPTSSPPPSTAVQNTQIIPVAVEEPDLAQALRLTPDMLGSYLTKLYDLCPDGARQATRSNTQQIPISQEEPELLRALQMQDVENTPFVSFVEQDSQSSSNPENLRMIPIAQEDPDLVYAIRDLPAGGVRSEGFQIPYDVQQFATQMKIPAEDLYNAMLEERVASLRELKQVFDQAVADSGRGGNHDFAIFVQNMVGCYQDRKSEDQLLSLIGVSSSTGNQQLNTAYSQKLQQIFRVEVGGFFLRNTRNANYNAFNLGNLIQDKLMKLSEDQRLSYLEHLEQLLSDRDRLLQRSKQVAQRFADQSMLARKIIKSLDDLEKLGKYLADLALYRLCFRTADKLPREIVALVPVDVYQCLEFIWGFPPQLTDKDSRITYVIQKLRENDPLYFHLR